MKALERENRELRRANEILKAAAAFFGAELDRQPQAMTAFIDEHRERVRGRADLRAAADRPVDLLRRQEPAALGTRPA